MQLGMVGLGRMGAGMTDRLRERGHDMKTYDPNVESTAGSLEELAKQLDKPRSVWMMVPAAIVDGVIGDLAPHLERGRHDHRRRELVLRRRSPALRRALPEGRITSTSASPAASGGWSAATA